MRLFEFNNHKRCLVIGGQHGDEPVGVDICKKLMELGNMEGLHIIPIANEQAFTTKTREGSGIDLNRSYGDTPTNILELDNVINTIKTEAAKADLVIDCHSTPLEGLDEISIYPNNHAIEMATYFGLPAYIYGSPENSLRTYCFNEGIPAITFEGVHEYHDESVAAGVAGILKVLQHLRIY